MNDKQQLEQDALAFHVQGRPGKIEIISSKPLTTQRDLSLAYSPGVAVPCLKIAEDPDTAYDYTSRGNLVAVISNGTAVLGLGAIGALASKPVMEGKAVLFKRFADVDSIDLEVDTTDIDAFVGAVRYLGPSFGGINLEDIKAPDCFIIEQRLRELMDIPVFHDDQHGTAIIAAAGMINALHLTGRDISTTRLVVNGAGAASIACVELLKALGMRSDNVTLCDSKGVIYQGRTEGMNQWKAAHAVATKARSLADALDGADVFFGLSVAGAVTKEMVKSMAAKPVIFAMANPDPEITPEDVKEVRPDAITATGRSDYPNQINNVLGFPYIFRGALDVRARTINEEMKVAAVHALAELAREDVPDEVAAAYGGRRLRYGPEYVIPVPFDPRLISHIPAAVAKAAMDSGVARKPIIDFGAYRAQLSARLDPTASMLHLIGEKVRSRPQRVVFAEGEEERVIRAALAFQQQGYGEAVLIGREDRVRQAMEHIGLEGMEKLEIHNARISRHNQKYRDFLFSRLQRQGHLLRDCQRMVNQDRNIFASCMVAMGDADAMITGTTRTFYACYEDVMKVIDANRGERPMGVSILLSKGRTIFVGDTNVHVVPSAEELVAIAKETAAYARKLGHEPRVALVSYSNFGNPMHEATARIREAVKLLDREKVDFEYEGEMSAAIALNYEQQKALYPFSRLSGSANVLVMPALQSAHVATRLMQSLGGGTVIGPVLRGLSKPVQICQMGSNVSDILNVAALAAHDAIG